MPMPIIAHFIGFDIDGCLLMEDSKSTMIHDNRNLWRTLNRQKAAFATTSVMLFSSRQSWKINELNRKNKESNSLDDPTSCFLPLKQIAEQNLTATLCPVLLSDPYAERADGYAYTRALVRAHDATAYHPDFIFDKNKTGLLYLHAHIAANNMRNCDFLSVATRPLSQWPCRSNAAYFYVEDEKALLYVNKIKKEVCQLPIQDPKLLNKMLTQVADRIENEEHDFENLDENNKVVKGITLTDAQIMEMAQISRHQHIKQDYLIIYDALEDLEAIMDRIHATYRNNRVLLPENVIVRLNQYNRNIEDFSRVRHIIRGTGPIDLKPKETLVKIAKQMLKKESFQDEDFAEESCFAAFIAASASGACFKTRSVCKPTVKHQASYESYAPISDYDYVLLPAQRRLITDFIRVTNQLPLLSQLAKIFSRNVKPLPASPLVGGLQGLQFARDEKEAHSEVAKLLAVKNYSTLVTPQIDALLREFTPVPYLISKALTRADEKEVCPPPQLVVRTVMEYLYVGGIFATVSSTPVLKLALTSDMASPNAAAATSPMDSKTPNPNW